MEYLAQFKPTSTISVHPPNPTSTISISPPGGTHKPHHGGQDGHLPLPTDTFPSAVSHYIHATHTGHNALWIVFAIFTAALVGVVILTIRTEKRNRLFHGISALVLTIAMISYFAMAAGLGVSYVPIHNHGPQGSLHHLFRQEYWARYVDWLFTTPLLLLSLTSLAGLSPATSLAVILTDVAMVILGLLGSLVDARWKHGEATRWGFFTVSTVAFLIVWGILFTGGMKAASYRAKNTKGLFTLLTIGTFLIWAAYPIVFALGEGANKINVNTEIIAYGVLDVIAKVGFTYVLLFLHTHDETGPWTLPEWWVASPQGYGPDGRGVYGSVGTTRD
ncbi:hypothetical protein CI109_103827 [Kwoniella shandongensis]|uniref:Uncharacterized protein n=1 Tax=Kwoniella shandongensis TaxID=1734106 RepID=A0A5M6C708_9TREE|nr:uncharacterized protein CI109_000477 [Kwoniella shandongensis]KAA5530907.1 hypothetical protein CI109_000477 [Kwoniella shandongensis]